MRKLLAKAQTRVGAVVIGGALLAVAAGGVATAAVIDSPATDEVSDVAPAPAEPTETTAVPATPTATNAPAPVPPDSPAVDAPAGSVEGVTEPEAQSTPEAEPEPTQPYDPTAPYVDPGSGFTYMPAPPLVVDPLPGETGYTPPAGR